MKKAVYDKKSDIATKKLKLEDCIVECNKNEKCVGVAWGNTYKPTEASTCVLKSTNDGMTDGDKTLLTYKKPEKTDEEEEEKSNDVVLIIGAVVVAGIVLVLMTSKQ